MEEDQGQRHCCRFCQKMFPCGRSLGGHMRTHMIMNSAETEDKLHKRKAPVKGQSIIKGSSYMGFEGGENAGYSLRENPKRTWRMSDSSDDNLQQGKVCKDCGKRFKSWKSLFGHLRCHTDRFHPGLVEEDPWNRGETYKQAFDNQSDNEGAEPMKRRRSRRRYGAIASPSFSFANAATSKIEQEQEDVAICLMMLSRDVGSWGGVNLVDAESSENSSVVLELKSSGMHLRIAEKGDVDFAHDSDKMNNMKPRGKHCDFDVSDMNYARVEKKKSGFGDSESKLLRDGVQKVESDVCDDGFVRYDKSKLDGSDEFVDRGTGFKVPNRQFGKDSCKKDRIFCFDIELGSDSRNRSQFNDTVTELWKDTFKGIRSNRVDSELGKCSSIKRFKSDVYDAELGVDLYKQMKYDASDNDVSKDQYNKRRYKCTTCNKTFHSYQALGGHRASHKKIKGCFSAITQISGNSIQTDTAPDPTAEGTHTLRRLESLIDGGRGNEIIYRPKKINGHECPICLKVFASGQALGGHKRSHLVGNSGTRAETIQTIVIQKQLPDFSDLLDLNLPAPVDGDSTGHVGYESWWVENNHKHETLMGLITN